MLKNVYTKLKMAFDTWKMWIFVAALFGTNGTQLYMNSEPASEKPAKTASTPSNLQKTIIIRKVDNEYCDKKLQEHKIGALH